MDRTFMYEII